MPSGYYIDANLLVLLVVGITGRHIVGKHRRTVDFTPEDYDLLARMLETSSEILVTPNILTEASNLLAQHREPQRTQLMAELRTLIDRSDETFVPSDQAAGHRHFPRLGLTDAALLSVVSGDWPLLTVDLDLYIAASHTDPRAAVNFNHLRDQ